MNTFTSRDAEAVGELALARLHPAATNAHGLALSAPAAGGITIAELSGELDIACAAALREQLLGLLCSGSSRLVIDLSKVSHCDASGLAVLIGTGARARLLGGFLRLAAVSPQVDQGLHITGLRQHLGVFPTVQAATASPAGSPRQRGCGGGVLDPLAGGGFEDGPEAGRVTVSLTELGVHGHRRRCGGRSRAPS